MDYKNAMKYIKEVGNFGSNYGLERTERLLELLGNPHKKIKVIHVAGTNGKGSTTSMIASMLINEGFKTGMYTSPFLEEFEERIQIDRRNISKEDVATYVEIIKEAVDKVIEEGYTHPTEFEIITCIMFKYFYDKKVDYAVVEVGLGGRLDSTNVVNPVLSVITSISLDHTNILGNTIEEIAREKGGIIKENTPLILYPQEKIEARDVLSKICNEKSSEIYEVKKENAKLIDINNEEFYQRIKINGLNKEYEINLKLLGEHQIINCIVALTAVEVLSKIEGFKLKNIEKGIESAVWKGRLEVLNKKPLIVIDGAHNIQGIKSLKENIEKYFNYNNMHLLIGILADKQVEDMINEIVPLSSDVIALTPNSYRAELASELEKEIYKVNKNVKSFESYKEGFLSVYKKAKEDDMILVTGSLYMIGEMRGIINNIIKENI
ncbi:MAG: bifunctional folylpolyglutamate synthase/dihydrofolate synthase [Clostridium baratii]|uniref:tetrahydrofolate synthase n=1 Tax=Clostridium baratii str. Sullivan TaxID=1415775 RepID=A0A0A7FXH3_9CLOT|nr:folylpolyglutamate synthase/dihydrofolate synthase family protein [Clostridium baratii]AIY84304.1 bifunctional FolC family protein [Clostridium baratii str. Sullivan]MBS6006618.1 bifunctional folylpolyglutamate synthase/dihydrofolate synthase [Clostridium baratii]MDU1053709.1 folylpolyglutamate synthase/dihydrofolate synthase family protein [Clostridium baratii]MDU4910609.1 folylpolyglutamate synthase/dihydrofolate synthase family protein [Clostridium baratii]CUO96389.1 bifunctional folylpo